MGVANVTVCPNMFSRPQVHKYVFKVTGPQMCFQGHRSTNELHVRNYRQIDKVCLFLNIPVIAVLAVFV